MISFFNRITFQNIILLPLLLALYLYLGWNNGGLAEFYGYKKQIDLGLWGTFPFNIEWNHRLNIAIITLNAFLITYLFNHYNFHDKTTILPTYMYLILLSNTDVFYKLDGGLIFQIFLILALIIIVKMSENSSNYYGFFNLGLLLGTGSSFSIDFLAFALFIFLSVLLIKPFKLRSFFLYLFGYLTPFVYLAFYLYFIHPIDVRDYFAKVFYFQHEWIHLFAYLNIATILIMLVVVFIGAQGLPTKVGIQKARQIRVFALISLLFGLIGLAFLFFNRTIDIFHFLVPPLALLFSILLLQTKKNFVYEAFFYMMLAYSLVKFFFQ